MRLGSLCFCLIALIPSTIPSICAAVVPAVRISEIHYDNVGTDTGEAIEISAPANTDVTGWQVVLYNGNGGASYDTRVLSGPVPATCGARGVMVVNYATNGIQNGGSGATDTTSPDGVALIDASGAVVEFLSYEGSFTATNGPAVGLSSTDIGVRELGTEPAGQSLARSASGAWAGPSANTFGACNDNGEEPPPPPDAASVTVTPASAAISAGATNTFTATGFAADGSAISSISFSWTSSVPTVATVAATGVATGISVGDTVITATAPNGIAGTAALHVNASLTGMPDIRFSEIHYDNVGTDTGEAIEVEGPAGASIDGYSIVLYDGNGGASYNTSLLSGTIPANCGMRGVVVVNYPQNGLQNGSPDGFALVDATEHLIEFLSYEGTFAAVNGPATGVTSTDIIASENSAPVGQSLQRDSSNHWALAASTFGACNGTGGSTPPPGNSISFSGRLPSDPALPVGFEDQLFATVHDANNVVVPTTISWSSDTPAIASIDSLGVMRALATGTAVLRATAADGVTTATYSLPTRVAVASTSAEYTGNTEFGAPQDSDPSDDFIVRYPQYTASYNPNRGTPNWVSYVLNATDFGPEDRCDCFTMDPALPSTFTHLTTADYTNAGSFAGYGIDRGHMARSFDRTTASLDNAVTFYFTNVVPQASDLNQGPWAELESELGDLARLQDKEVYIIAGVAGNKGTLKNEGKIVIPASTWKVAVIMPRHHGLADIVDYRDLQVIAVNMPNDPGVRNVPWQTYQTTVDAIEQLTGYDLLALLPDDVETAVESGTQPPIVHLAGPSNSAEGDAVAWSAAGSIDPNGTIVNYDWNFGDGTTATGADVRHVYSQDGSYVVRVTLMDNDGLTTTVARTISVANVAPVIGTFAGATLVAGQAYTAAGPFTDPGADTWTATVDWGDGTAAGQATLGTRSFSLSHTYNTPGTFTVTVSIADDHTSATQTQTVTVTPNSPQLLASAQGQVDQLVAANKISQGAGALFKSQLTSASSELAHSRNLLAVTTLHAVLAELDVLVLFSPLTAGDVAPLRALILQVISST
ncbi:MAG TPA: DNA/RNA non-specific endonuclease [Steroidobacteraceae bacterium]